MVRNDVNPCPQPVAPITRSESLSQLFQSFMEADKELHDARENLASVKVAVNDAEMRLVESEKRWSNVTENFAQFMASEAPPQLKKQIEDAGQSISQSLNSGSGFAVGGSTRSSRW